MVAEEPEAELFLTTSKEIIIEMYLQKHNSRL
jgi:hypothetical protein